MYRENNKGLITPPCLTPFKTEKLVETWLPDLCNRVQKVRVRVHQKRVQVLVCEYENRVRVHAIEYDRGSQPMVRVGLPLVVREIFFRGTRDIFQKYKKNLFSRYPD